jgi:hypothetical protein
MAMNLNHLLARLDDLQTKSEAAMSRATSAQEKEAICDQAVLKGIQAIEEAMETVYRAGRAQKRRRKK